MLRLFLHVPARDSVAALRCNEEGVVSMGVSMLNNERMLNDGHIVGPSLAFKGLGRVKEVLG